ALPVLACETVCHSPVKSLTSEAYVLLLKHAVNFAMSMPVTFAAMVVRLAVEYLPSSSCGSCAVNKAVYISQNLPWALAQNAALAAFVDSCPRNATGMTWKLALPVWT